MLPFRRDLCQQRRLRQVPAVPGDRGDLKLACSLVLLDASDVRKH